jgi:hypothetical protein
LRLKRTGAIPRAEAICIGDGHAYPRECRAGARIITIVRFTYGFKLTIRIADSERPDPLCPDPIGELAQTLGEISDPETVLKYVLWLAPRDADKALTVSCRLFEAFQYLRTDPHEPKHEIWLEA